MHLCPLCVLQSKDGHKNIQTIESRVMRAGFISLTARWGAAVCAQTRHSRDHTQWLTGWAPKPRDVYCRNSFAAMHDANVLEANHLYCCHPSILPLLHFGGIGAIIVEPGFFEQTPDVPQAL